MNYNIISKTRIIPVRIKFYYNSSGIKKFNIFNVWFPKTDVSTKKVLIRVQHIIKLTLQ